MESNAPKFRDHALPQYRSTDVMQRAVAALCVLLTVRISDARFVLRTARRVARIVRDMIVQEEWNALILAKSEMLRSPSWRGRVLRDLGGNTALSEWEASQSRHTTHQNSYQVSRQESHSTSPTHYTVQDYSALPSSQIFYDFCKIDQEGQFRLPPLARGMRHIGSRKFQDYEPFPNPKKQIIKTQVIAVFPHEFRAASTARVTHNTLGKTPQLKSRSHKVMTVEDAEKRPPYAAPIRGQP